MALLRRRSLAMPALCVVFCFLATSAADAAAVLSDAPGTTELTAQASFAPAGRAAARVLAGRVHFQPLPPPAARGTADIWVRIALAPQSGAAGPWVLSLPRSVTRGDAYIPAERGYRHLQVGSSVPYARHAEAFMLAGVTIDRAAIASHRPVYFRLTYYPDSPFWLRAETLRYRMSQTFLYRLINGLFFGVLLAIGLCNLYVFLAVRDRSASWFVAYVGALIANELVMTGLGAAYLWPSGSIDSRWPGVLTSVLAFGTFLGFTRSFLQTRSQAPVWDRLLIASFVAVAVSDIGRHAVSGGEKFAAAVLVIQFAAMAVTVGAAIVRVRAGYHPARFFVAAFVPALIGITANLAYAVWAPGGNWFFAENGVEFGAMAECVILSFSLLDRIRVLDVQRAQTEAELARTAQRNAELKTLASRDPLTGISNRLAFFERFEDEIEYARRTGLLLGVLYIDLDDFKAVNDRYGHRVGDILLQIVSRRLKNAVRPADTVARLGGDEFAVLVTGVTDASVLDAVQANVVRILDTHVVIEGALIGAGMSVGAAIFPRDGDEADAIIEAADHRMYHAKQGGAQAPAQEGSSSITPA